MKRILVCLLCAFSLHVCLASYGQNIGLDSYSKEDIPTPKECKKICKQLEKEGWTVHGAGYSLEESLTKYYQRQEADHLYSIIGTGEAKNINVAIRKATNNASIQYASLKGVQVEGTEVSKIQTSTSEDADNGSETFSSSFVSSVNQNVKSLKPYIILKRQLTNKKIEVQIYCLVKQ